MFPCCNGPYSNAFSYAATNLGNSVSFAQIHKRATDRRLPIARGGTPYSGLYGEVPPERGGLFQARSMLKVGKITILVYERVTKSAAKWKRWRINLSM